METDADNRCIYAYSTILNLNDEETDKFIPDIVRKLREGSKGDKEFEDFLKLGKPKEGERRTRSEGWEERSDDRILLHHNN